MNIKNLRRSFALKIFIINSVLLISILSILSLFVINGVKLNANDREVKLALYVTNSLKYIINTNLDNLSNSLLIVSKSVEIKEDDENTSKIIKNLVDNTPLISSCLIYDKNANECYQYGLLELDGISEEAFFIESMKGKVYFSDIIKSDEERKHYIIISAPIYKYEKVEGVLLAKIELSSLSVLLNNLNVGDKGYTFITSSDGRAIAHINSEYVNNLNDFSNLEPVIRAMDGDTGVVKYKYDGEEYLSSYTSVEKNRWYIIYQIPISSALLELNVLVRQISYLIVVIIIVSVIIFIIASYLNHKPINEIVLVMSKISESNYNERFDNVRKDELGVIQNKFNEMMDLMQSHKDSLEDQVKERTSKLNYLNIDLNDKIRLLEETQYRLIQTEKDTLTTRLMNQFSHALNTPLGSVLTLSTYICDSLKSDKVETSNSKKHKLAIETIISEVRKMCQIIDALRAIENSGLSSKFEYFNLSTYMKDVLEKLKKEVYLSDMSIDMDVETDILIESNREAISNVVKELLVNTYNHGRLECEIKIFLKIFTFDDKVHIQYSDDGAGVEVENLDKIFEPFYKERMSSPGVGIGLSITKNVVDRILLGDIDCNINDKNNLQFEVRLNKQTYNYSKE